MAETPASGVAVRANTSQIDAVLAASLPASNEPGVYHVTGEHVVERIRAALASLSPANRADVRAALIDEQGRVNPWTATEVDVLLRRVETPWLPGLINERRLTFHAQPIVALEPGGWSVFGFEALMRSDDSRDGLTPGVILEAARAHQALTKLDQICRAGAILSLFPLLRADERLFVNFLPITVYDPDVCLRTTMAACERVGAPVSRLVFEVVESEQFPDIDHLREILAYYRRAGASVALDDLGTGHTSLMFIEELRPDYIKIDKGLLRAAADDGRDDLMRGIVAHARRMGIRVIAEGVESARDLTLVRDMGADFAQGWHIARPAAELPRPGEWLAAA